MRITDYSAIGATKTNKKKRSDNASSTSFADLLESSATGDAEAVTSLSDISATSAINNMLALQEISEEEVARKKILQKGENLIDELDQLRTQLLMGEVPYSTLQRLGRQLSVQRQAVDDPALLALIEDIELRAAVELAKLEKAASKDKI